MDPLNQVEVQHMALSLQTLVGSRLQETYGLENELGLGFYGESRKLQWLWVDLKPSCPMLLLLEEVVARPSGLSKVQKPLLLFLKTHALGKVLQKIEAPEELGRVLLFHLGSGEESVVLELRLFPRGQNVLVHSVHFDHHQKRIQKSISWNKPLPLSPSSSGREPQEVRSLAELYRQWLKQKNLLDPQKTPAQNQQVKWQRDIEKKRLALERMASDLQQKQQALHWRKLGEWLKEHQTLKIPSEWSGLLPSGTTLSEAIPLTFQKAKQNEKKMASTKERMLVLEQEILQLEEKLKNPLEATPEEKAPPPPRFKTPVKMRTLEISPKLQAFLGRSAKDNLLLLRQAQAWDFWMHLSDRPGAHLILRRTKNQVISEQELEKAAQWLVKETASRHLHSGDFFEVLIAEVRYVKPLKGDKLGRVTVTEKQTRRYKRHD
ncbi:MAG: hypothetical protein AB7F59_08715 [Bdellovibrionales bacterium]